MIKTCAHCRETKDVSFFYFRKSENMYRSQCIVCFQTDNNKRQKKNRKLYPEINSFYNAKQRCEDKSHPKYYRYGARGIKMKIKSWKELVKLLGPKPVHTSLDRINNNGHYEKGNIRWASSKEQAHNTSKFKLTESFCKHVKQLKQNKLSNIKISIILNCCTKTIQRALKI